MRRKTVGLAVTTACLAAVIAVGAATAQTVDCGEYLGLVCEGYLTDEPDVTTQRDVIETEIERVTATHGNPLAVAIADDARGQDPFDFAVNTANAWGVGDPVDEDGIFVLVAIAERRTEIALEPNVDLPVEAIAAAGRPFFAEGDFDGGVLAIVGAIDTALATGATSADSGGGVGWLVVAGIVFGGLGIGVASIVSARRTRQESKRRGRNRRIDTVLGQLDPRGDEVEMLNSFRIAPLESEPVPTERAITALLSINSNKGSDDSSAVASLLTAGALVAVDTEAMVEATREPLELRSSGEAAILESGVDSAARHATAVPLSEDESFEIAMAELEDVVQSLRPHRVAVARRATADALVTQLVDTPHGSVVVTHLGTLVLRSSPVLDGEGTFGVAAHEVALAHEIAQTKVQRMETLRSQMAISDTRDVASVALADMSVDPAISIERYSATLEELEKRGAALVRDHVPLPAVAALLAVNNSVENVDAFVDGYKQLRTAHEPLVALEGALAGLFTSGELDAARDTAGRLGLPVAIALALSRRRPDGVDIYRDLLSEIASVAEPSDAKVIAGVLAMSLEPSVARLRWEETRSALGALGLHGSYADVAAAFGASDPRGPYSFALSYAAQRSALEDAGYTSLTRYAPELAHAGTSGGTDTWTGSPIGGSPRDFDPFTFFYLHWAASGAHAGGSGWDGLYSSPSWQDGGSSWWGGGDGFGDGGGGSGWGSSWSGGSGSFGGFSGGGGFGGGGGGGW